MKIDHAYEGFYAEYSKSYRIFRFSESDMEDNTDTHEVSDDLARDAELKRTCDELGCFRFRGFEALENRNYEGK
jgi:hypothetical protein